MNQIFLSSTNMWSASLEDMMHLVQTFHLKGIELWAQQFESKKHSITEYLALSKAYQIDTIIHSTSWDLNFASLNESIRHASLKEIKKSILLAKQVQAKEVTIHPPRQTIGGMKQYHVELAYQGLRELYYFSEENGICLSLEIMEKKPKELITTDKELLEITRDLYDKFSYTLDLAHCENETEFIGYLNTIPHISKLHISNKIGYKLHTDLPNGDFNFTTIMPIINKLDIPMVLEGFHNEAPFIEVMDNLNFLKHVKENYL